MESVRRQLFPPDSPKKQSRLESLIENESDLGSDITAKRKAELPTVQREYNAIVALREAIINARNEGKDKLKSSDVKELLNAVTLQETWDILGDKKALEKMRVRDIVDPVVRAFHFVAEIYHKLLDLTAESPCSRLRWIRETMRMINNGELSLTDSKKLSRFITTLETLHSDIIKILENIQLIYELILEWNEFCITEIALFLRMFDPRYGIICCALKVTDNGVISDDNRPHDATHITRDGLITFNHQKAKDGLTVRQLEKLMLTTSKLFINTTQRLRPHVMRHEGMVDYCNKIVSCLVRMVQDKYITNLVCIRNFMSRNLKRESVETEELYGRFQLLMKKDIPMCIEKVFQTEPAISRQWIEGIKDNIGVMSADYLFKLRDDRVGLRYLSAYQSTYKDLMKNYISNLVYIFTHSGSRVVFYRLEKRESGHVLKKAAVVTEKMFVISRFLDPKYFISKYEYYDTKHYKTRSGDFVVMLKDTIWDILENKYIDYNTVNNGEILTALEVCVLFILSLSDNVDDIYFSVDSVINAGRIAIAPHLPYKFISTRHRGEPSEKLLMDTNISNALGVNDYAYLTVDNFTDNKEFVIGNHKLYMFSIFRQLDSAISSNLGRCMTNFWFAKRLFVMFDSLRLENNIELAHLIPSVPIGIEKILTDIGSYKLPFLYDNVASEKLKSVSISINMNQAIKRKEFSDLKRLGAKEMRAL